jgi:hypothetical protein
LGIYKAGEEKSIESNVLTNDAFHVATITKHRIINIATNDPDFERLTEIGKRLNLKGDHHEDALFITVNVEYELERQQDVFFAIA